jgi:YHS domain-containing protein
VTMVIAALVVTGLFSLAGALPSGARPSRSDIFGQVQVNYKLFLNVFGTVIFAALFWLTFRRGATDPSCGMRVDRGRALKKRIAGHTYYFCSEHCLDSFEGQSKGDSSRQSEPANAH